MSVLVFGAGGQLGSALAARDGVNALDRSQCDITDSKAIAAVLSAFRPDAIVNAAAYTAVDKAEAEPDMAFHVNAIAPGLIAQEAGRLGIPVIHISTDCVFSGAGSAPYSEENAATPINVYGESKLKGEQAVLAASPDNLVVRVSWVFSASGSNFLHVVLKLAAKLDQLRIVSDQIGGPTYAGHLARDLLAMVPSLKGRGGVYHYCGAPFVSRADFAREILKQAGLSSTVTEIPTADFPTPAERPLNSRLDCSKIEKKFGLPQPDWREGLAEVLNELKVSPSNG